MSLRETIRKARKALESLGLGKARRRRDAAKANRKARAKRRKVLIREREVFENRLDAIYEKLERDPDNEQLQERAANHEVLIEQLTKDIERVRNAVQKFAGEAAEFTRKARRRRKKKAKLKKRIARARKKLKQKSLLSKWPSSGSFTELMYHAPGPHIHAASADRDFLIRVFTIARDEYQIRVGEFPPFDPVECVHVNGSWHYRDSSNAWLPRLCSARGDGLAGDLNDADGGSDRELAFYAELRRRYA